MNLLENEVQNQKNKKAKIIMIIIAILIVILIGACVFIGIQIQKVENSKLKFIVDGKSTTIPENLFITENDTLYINIKKFAELVGYHTYNGDFKNKYSEDTANCYIADGDGEENGSTNEYASYSLNSATMYKQVQPNKNNTEESYDYEYFEIEKPVILRNNELYVSKDGMEIGTNSLITYNESNNTIRVNTLNNIAEAYASKFTNSVINMQADKVNFNNKKALRQGLVVIMTEDEHFGVCDKDGNEIIGTKYANIEYKEGSNEFTVMTDEGKKGILSIDGTTKIEPNYSEIKQISKELNYYLVQNNNKYGVINQNGNLLIFLEYDQIGVDTKEFTSNDIENPYLLYDKCIPVMQNGKWGVFNTDGELIIPLNYTSIGCVNKTNKEMVTNNVLIIPEYEAIVMGNAEGKYAILDSEGKEYVPAILDSVYSTTTQGKVEYYITITQQQEQNGKMVDVQQRIGLTQLDVFQEKVEQPQLNTNTTVNDPNNVATENVIVQNEVMATPAA